MKNIRSTIGYSIASKLGPYHLRPALGISNKIHNSIYDQTKFELAFDILCIIDDNLHAQLEI